MRRSERLRFILFLLVGFFNTVVNYLIFLGLIALAVQQQLAVVASWVIGIGFNFMTTGRVVFQSSRVHLLPRFVLVYVIQLAANLVLLRLATRMRFNVPLAQAAILCLLAIVTFFAMRLFVFRTKDAA